MQIFGFAFNTLSSLNLGSEKPTEFWMKARGGGTRGGVPDSVLERSKDEWLLEILCTSPNEGVKQMCKSIKRNICVLS